MPYETSNVHVPGAGVGVGDRPGRNDMSDPRERGGKDVILRTDQLEKTKHRKLCVRSNNNSNIGACRMRKRPGGSELGGS